MKIEYVILKKTDIGQSITFIIIKGPLNQQLWSYV
mgnify:CR=1 FL=1